MATHPTPPDPLVDAPAVGAAARGDDDDGPLLRPLADPTWADRLEDARARVQAAPHRVVGAVVAVALLAGVGWWLLRPPSAPPIETSLPRAAVSSGPAGSSPASGSAPAGSAPAGPSTTATTVATHVVAQAAGAVRRPGVYRLPVGARVTDLVAAAGGLAADADGDRVNLAAPVGDGERIWIPPVGGAEPPVVVAGGTDPSPPGGPPGTGGSGAGGGAGATPTVVNLNTATERELEDLPGVGPATAAAIVAYRDQHGPFTSVDDLLEVRGIGEAKLEQLRPQASV